LDQLQQDLNKNLPSSEVNIVAVNEVGHHGANETASALTDLPLIQDTRAEDVWNNWNVTYRDVQVFDSDGEVTGVFNLSSSSNDLNRSANYDHVRGLIVDAATSKRVAGSAHQNRIEPMDTTKDGFVAPNDVLAIINKINRDGAGELPSTDGETPGFYYDVSGDNFVTALDALRIIQVLNRLSRSGSGEPDEVDVAAAAEPPSHADATDAIFALAIADDSDDDEDDEE